MKSWGRVLAYGGLLALAGMVPVAAGWSGLPDPVATHWSGGAADGSMSKAWLFALPVGLVLLGLFTTSFLRRESVPSVESMSMVGILGGVGVWLTTTVVIVNSGASSWEEVELTGGWHIAGLAAAAGIFGLIGYLLGRRWFWLQPQVDEQSVAPSVELGENERVFWRAVQRVWWPLIILVPLGIGFLLLAEGLLFWIGAFFLAAAAMLTFVVVEVDGNGLRVKLGGLVPIRRIAVGQVASSRAIDLEPAAWGGWGYRMGVGRTAIVLRRGDAIEVRMKNDKLFAVTVEDAATGAALLNGLVARRARKV